MSKSEWAVQLAKIVFAAYFVWRVEVIISLLSR